MAAVIKVKLMVKINQAASGSTITGILPVTMEPSGTKIVLLCDKALTVGMLLIQASKITNNSAAFAFHLEERKGITSKEIKITKRYALIYIIFLC